MLNTSAVFVACIIALAVSAAVALPVHNSGDNYYGQSAWERSGQFEGDILLSSKEDKNGLLDEDRYWPNKTLVYYIDPMFDSAHVELIMAAIAEYHARTCITMRPYVEGVDEHYVHIKGDKPDECSSFIGMQRFAQNLNLGNEGCFVHGTILHELLHALGFYHMQSAANRDDYVIIHWANIIPADTPNFVKMPNATTSDFGVPYDYGSVMHYGAYAFSANGEPTIEPIEVGAEIGQRVGLAESDIEKLEIMYKCRDPIDTGY